VSIGDEAFMNSSIKRIDIPSSVTVLNNKAFAELNNVEEIILHESLSSIGKGVFYHSSLPKSIEIPSSVKIIGDEAFLGIKNVDEVILHEGLDSIGHYAFGGASIKKIDFPSTVTKLGSYIFHSSDLQEIEWPKNLHKIPHGCFTFTKLNRFDFTHIKEIGFSAFGNCELMGNVVIPSGCSIHPLAFSGCKSQNLDFEELPQEIPLSRDNQTFLDNYSFCGSLYLKKLVLPRGLLINNNAFKSSKTVKTIEIHEGVEFYSDNVFVGDDAYDGHDNFIGYSDNWIPDSIIYLSANPEETYDIFQDVMYERSTLYVKPEALEKAKNTYPWSKFRKIVALSSGIDDIPADTDDGQNGPDLFYNLEGIPCGSDRNALAPGIYILRKNGKASKIVI
ncbi:MAG: leucine-rich repeat domain-containing protein, partial [Muribaculaceae bacterium]|nr:leucine-rich repeat domain-containing protein [Muribaculaceae bacterium]